MSGATAAHASYNGSGTQGLAVTNKINDTGDITSVFWTKDKTTKQLLHGNALIEIPASGNAETAGSNIIFTLNSDMDVIGDLYLYCVLTSDAIYSIDKEYGLLNLFERIEFQCGTQIWQTLEFADILALNTTELSEGAYEKFILGTHGYFDSLGNRVPIPSADIAITANRAFSFRLPLLTRNISPLLPNFSNISETGFLTAAAPNQTVKIKIFTNKLTTMTSNGMLSATPGNGTIDVRLYGKHMIMCNDEREKIRNIPGGIAKRLKLTQYRDQTTFPTPTTARVVTTELDCDHFSLYASHLIIQIFDSSVMDDSLTSTDTCSSLVDADLRLNSTSFCGKLTGGMMASILPETMGLRSNVLYTRTDPHIRTIVYVFPLASRAFSGSGVPLNRFDNIRLSLNLFVPTSLTLNRVTVTCVGETTALYKQGAASISMY
jgi:hypothetical protein